MRSRTPASRQSFPYLAFGLAFALVFGVGVVLQMLYAPPDTLATQQLTRKAGVEVEKAKERERELESLRDDVKRRVEEEQKHLAQLEAEKKGGKERGREGEKREEKGEKSRKKHDNTLISDKIEGITLERSEKKEKGRTRQKKEKVEYVRADGKPIEHEQAVEVDNTPPSTARGSSSSSSSKGGSRGHSSTHSSLSSSSSPSPPLLSTSLAQWRSDEEVVVFDNLMSDSGEYWRPVYAQWKSGRRGKHPMKYLTAKSAFLKGQLMVVDEQLQHAGYTEAGKNEAFDLLWVTRGSCDRGHYKPPYRHLHPSVKVNCFLGTRGIASKTRLPVSMKSVFGMDEAFKMLPMTFNLPEEKEQLMKEVRANPKAVWVSKTNAHRGQSVNVVEAQEIIDNPSAVLSKPIVQKYVEDPLLIDGYKFGVRVWVVPRSVDPLKVYIYKDGLTLFTTHKYESGDALKDKSMQLTNVWVNKATPGQQLVWDMAELKKYFDHSNLHLTFEQFWEFVVSTVRKNFVAIESAVANAFKNEYKGTGPRHYQNNLFELLGYDFLIDSKGKPWLLEINFTPSTATESDKSHRVKSHLLRDLFHLVHADGHDEEGGVHNVRDVDTYENREEKMVAAKRRSEKDFELFVLEHYPTRVQSVVLSSHLCPLLPSTNATYSSTVGARSHKHSKVRSMKSCISCIMLEEVEAIRQFELEYERRGNFEVVLPSAASIDDAWPFLSDVRRSDFVLNKWVKAERDAALFFESVICRSSAGGG
uniref:Tubulin--tyrosine ligase-like protein 5 n=1 Tax=Palpitomonas bilix TaxID=652834 RepID=A0A7S3G1I1_9EUKA|mmetsp:Transcript_14527/g.37061  ORF Transcript_14527/g.37061 Transcript_14527/m.37061 type:complete len:755 (+) Transcript_14527:194-2458(+)|eukprot:CAMPEP_0113876490 /NCGR_PEP_ID=MMETSP0780_2-20120614/5519_1 /TAXON_ID=652834 /ORGANISM="Palpitomonas bilix" /LENGTH=754 /DNA_ID=CAMNT_0000862581 /DNA_START=68 /DNA_END=2332 /DNA_ORIENTATION=- /assembly_acc=CAM_ASM_000599